MGGILYKVWGGLRDQSMAGEAPRDYQWQEAMVIPGPKGQKEGLDVSSYERRADTAKTQSSGDSNNTLNSALLLMTSIGQIQPEARGQESLDESSKENPLQGHMTRE